MQFKRPIKLFVTLFMMIAFVGTCFAESINWQSYSSTTFANAKKNNRQVLLFAKATWCPWCKRMSNDTFTNSAVVSLINKNYVPVMIDIDDQSSIADRFDISVVPASFILTGDYKVVDSRTGYLTPSQMTTFLRRNSN